MKGLYFFIMLSVAVNCAWSDIYKSVDAHGNVQFSDIPSKGAVRIELPESQSFTPRVSTEAEPEELPTKHIRKNYTKVSIVQPFNEETIRVIDATVQVKVAVEPELQKSDRIELVYDGVSVGKPQGTLTFTLGNVYRGAHTIQVNVLNPQDEVVGTSKPVRFFMQTPRVNNLPR